jgi:dTDP-4-amino-4,6-dideoxygalactose transaminase
LVARAEILREKGTDRSRFMRGQVDKYTWVDIGSSYVVSDMLAAYLFGQLEHMGKITKRRGEIYNGYAAKLAPLVERGCISIPRVPQHCTANYHMFYILTADAGERAALVTHFARAGILAVWHYVPLHSSPFGRTLTASMADLPVTDDRSGRLLRLPMYYDLTDQDVADVASALLDFYDKPAA